MTTVSSPSTFQTPPTSPVPRNTLSLSPDVGGPSVVMVNE